MSRFSVADRSRISELLSFIVRSQQVEECLFIPVLCAPWWAGAAITEHHRLDVKQKSISHSSGGWKVQDQGAGMFNYW